MICKECDSCRKGFFRSQPDSYVCIGVKTPFVIDDIYSNCTAYDRSVTNECVGEICSDNRFELIEKYKRKLIEATNIETAEDEMKVIDSILFRFWQMGWLDKLER